MVVPVSCKGGRDAETYQRHDCDRRKSGPTTCPARHDPTVRPCGLSEEGPNAIHDNRVVRTQSHPTSSPLRKASFARGRQNSNSPMIGPLVSRCPITSVRHIVRIASLQGSVTLPARFRANAAVLMSGAVPLTFLPTEVAGSYARVEHLLLTSSSEPSWIADGNDWLTLPPRQGAKRSLLGSALGSP